jgi:tRNA pseudouridine55 synthase
VDGVIVVDKPEGWTSHDVVNKMRRITGTRKVGHLGTLDPIATGVLPLVVGRATRLAQFYQRNDKIYEAVIRFGYATDTYDRDGAPTSPQIETVVDRDALERRLTAFRGEFCQIPPPVSAKKIDGKRAYELARRNVAVELPPVRVQMFELTLVKVEGAEAVIRAHCSGGTYLRSIAHDLGVGMKVGAHLRDLRRLASGDFTIEQAHSVSELESMGKEGRLAEVLVPPAQLLPEFPEVFVDAPVMAQIRQGRSFPASPFRSRQGTRYVKAISRAGELVAIGEARLPNLYHPVVVL